MPAAILAPVRRILGLGAPPGPPSPLRLLLLAGLLAALSPPPVLAGEDWSISSEAVYPNGQPANRHIQELVRQLERSQGEGEAVSLEEFLAACDRADPEINREALLRYATPGSVRKQNQDHADYSKALQKSDRIQAGRSFLQEHDSLLTAARERYGVEPRDIVAVLMWESGLGQNAGRHRVFNVLLGQILYLEEARESAVNELKAAGDYDPSLDPSLAEQEKSLDKLIKRAIANLTALVRLSKAMDQDPTGVVGSWGAAIGYPQFMPSSLQFAVDGDGDGLIDLKHWPDAVFSVANYLEEHGYGPSLAERRRALFRYNRLDSYVEGVLRYSEAISRP